MSLLFPPTQPEEDTVAEVEDCEEQTCRLAAAEGLGLPRSAAPLLRSGGRLVIVPGATVHSTASVGVCPAAS